MQCANHPGVEPAGRCVRCGTLLCRECMVELDKVYCPACDPRLDQEAEPPTQPDSAGQEPETYPVEGQPGTGEQELIVAPLAAGEDEVATEEGAPDEPLKEPGFPGEPCTVTADDRADIIGKIRPGRAFSFVFDDPDWLQKCALGSLFTLISVFLIPFFMVMGYMFEVMKNTMAGVEHRLPAWEMTGERLKEGVLFVLLGIFYSIPFFVFMAATAVVGTLTGGSTGPGQFLALLFFLIGWLCTIAMLGLVMILVPAAAQLFAMSGSFRDALDFKKVFKLVERNFRQRAFALGLTIITFWFMVPFGLLLCGVGVFATVFYSLLVVWRIHGEIARQDMCDEEFMMEMFPTGKPG